MIVVWLALFLYLMEACIICEGVINISGKQVRISDFCTIPPALFCVEDTVDVNLYKQKKNIH